MSQTSQSSGGTFFGLRWYWWIIIVIVIIIIIGSLSSIFGGANDLGRKLAEGVLGFAGGVLTVLAKSPLAWFFAVIFLGPFAYSSACSAFKFYKNHFGTGKSNADVVKELGFDKDGLEKILKENKDLQETIERLKTENKQNREVIKELEQKVNDLMEKQIKDCISQINETSVQKKYDDLEAQYNYGDLTYEEVFYDAEKFDAEMDKIAEEDGVEPPEKVEDRLKESNFRSR